MTVEEVLGRVRILGPNLVELTGGEPLLQKEVYPLTEQLLAEGYRVLVETSGERFVGDLPKDVVKIVDVKCPGSGESARFCYANLAELNPQDQVKFVILDENDYHYACEFMGKHDLARKVSEVIFSPVFGKLPFRLLAELILRDNLNVRLGLQLHKIIWNPDARGV